MYEKVVLVTRHTRLEDLTARFNTASQAEFYIEHAGGDFSDYEEEHTEYADALRKIKRSVPSEIKVQVLDREYLSTYLFAKTDLVVTLGQDGLVANTAKYVGGQPIIAVNPDPARFDGVLMPFLVDELPRTIEKVLGGKLSVREVTLASATMNNGQRLLAFNDLFIGARTHVSARYRIRAGNRSEDQSSSGVIVSTGAGSSGWLSSVFNMAAGVAGSSPGGTNPQPRMMWNEERLIFVVREPFISRTSQAGIVTGEVAAGSSLEIESRMPTSGVIFSDGIEADYLEFNSGSIATIGIAPEKARLVAK